MKADEGDQGSPEKIMNDEKYNKGIHLKQAWEGLTRLNWTHFVPQILLTLMDINWILKIIVFGSGLFTNDIVNLKH